MSPQPILPTILAAACMPNSLVRRTPTGSYPSNPCSLSNLDGEDISKLTSAVDLKAPDARVWNTGQWFMDLAEICWNVWHSGAKVSWHGLQHVSGTISARPPIFQRFSIPTDINLFAYQMKQLWGRFWDFSGQLGNLTNCKDLWFKTILFGIKRSAFDFAAQAFQRQVHIELNTLRQYDESSSSSSSSSPSPSLPSPHHQDHSSTRFFLGGAFINDHQPRFWPMQFATEIWRS